jgi:hypothetical protein
MRKQKKFSEPVSKNESVFMLFELLSKSAAKTENSIKNKRKISSDMIPEVLSTMCTRFVAYRK